MEQITFVGERILDGSGTIELPDHEWVNNRRRAIEIFQEDKGEKSPWFLPLSLRSPSFFRGVAIPKKNFALRERRICRAFPL